MITREGTMFASVIEVQLKSGTLDEAVDITRAALPEMREIPGLRQFISIDKGNDQGVIVAIYESQAAQEAATPKAQEILGRIAGLAAAPPQRLGCEVTINEQF